jgi:hypothetical protein
VIARNPDPEFRLESLLHVPLGDAAALPRVEQVSEFPEGIER